MSNRQFEICSGFQVRDLDCSYRFRIHPYKERLKTTSPIGITERTSIGS